MSDNSAINILIIDDEDIVRLLLSDMIRTLGFNVYEFSDPMKAVDFYDKNFKKIDLVLLDMIMPNLNGRESFFLLKKINREIKSIVLSGYSLNEDIDLILKEGCNGYLKKPIKLKELRQIIDKVLSIESNSDQAELTGVSVKEFMNIPEIDVEEALGNLGGNIPLFIRMLGKFVDNYKDAGRKINTSSDVQICDELMILSHSIKSASGSLGINKLKILAEKVEALSIKRDIISCVESSAEFFDEVKRVSEKIEEFINTYNAINTHESSKKEQVEKEIVLEGLNNLLYFSKINRPKETGHIFKNKLEHIFCNNFGIEQKEIILKKLRGYRFEELTVYIEKIICEVSNG